MTVNASNCAAPSRMTLICLGLVWASAAIAAPVPPPPPIPEGLEPVPEPVATSAPATEAGEVTVFRRDGDRIEEFRLKGRLYMIKVYPKVGPPYTLVDDRGDGVFNRQDTRGAPMKPAQWKVLSW